MKKLFTLLCLVVFSATVFAQTNVRKKAFDDYGTLVTIFSEDFSKITTGSYGDPDYLTSLCYPLNEVDNPWWNIKPEFTQKEHWGGMNVWPAGGSVFLEATSTTGGARLNLPNIDGTDRGAKVILRFKARTDTEMKCNCAFVEGGETHNMGPEWDFFPTQVVGEITDEWKTYEFLFEEVGASSIFLIGVEMGRGTDLAPIYIDDVELLQIDQVIDSPDLLPHTWYTGHGETASFQANWKPVTGADYYLIDIFTLDGLGNPQTYLRQDERVDGTSYTVDDAESGQTYFYTVRSVKDGDESLPSARMAVVGLGQPENLTATEIVDGKFEASWDAVPTAQFYNYNAYFAKKAETDGSFTLVDEKMENLRFPEGMVEYVDNVPVVSELAGKHSHLTLSQYLEEKQKLDNQDPSVDPIYFQAFGRYDITDFVQSGWYATNAMPFAECLRLDGWFYQFNAGDAGLISPDLDLSKNNGVFNVELSTFGIVDEYDILTSCAVALFNYNEETSSYEQAELIYAEQAAEAWQNNTFSFTKGTAKSMLGIYAVRGAESLFIDNLKISQNYAAGEVLYEPFFTAPRTSQTSVEVNLPSHVVDADVYHRVQAIRTADSSNPNIPYTEVFSNFCEMESVGHGTSSICVPNVEIQGATVQLRNGQLVVNNVDNAPVEVYTLSGERVYTDNSGRKSIGFSLKSGAYIVKVGKQAIKVVL